MRLVPGNKDKISFYEIIYQFLINLEQVTAENKEQSYQDIHSIKYGYKCQSKISTSHNE